MGLDISVNVHGCCKVIASDGALHFESKDGTYPRVIVFMPTNAAEEMAKAYVEAMAKEEVA